MKETGKFVGWTVVKLVQPAGRRIVQIIAAHVGASMRDAQSVLKVVPVFALLMVVEGGVNLKAALRVREISSSVHFMAAEEGAM